MWLIISPAVQFKQVDILQHIVQFLQLQTFCIVKINWDRIID